MFADLLEQAVEQGDHQHVYIDGNAFHQSGLEQAFLDVAPQYAESLQEAKETGGSVQINMADFINIAADTELGNDLRSDIRFEPDGLSLREIQDNAQAELEADVARKVENLARNQEKDAELTKIRDEIHAQLNAVSRFRPEANRNYAVMLTAMFESLGSRLQGETVRSVFERHMPKIMSQIAHGQGFEQHYRRNNRDTPFNDVPYMMFADDADRIAHYGDTLWELPDDAGNRISVSDEAFREALGNWARDNIDNLRESGYDYGEDADAFVEAFVNDADPADIVDSAQLWDIQDAWIMNDIWEQVLAPNGWDTVITSDGAITFNPDIVRRVDMDEDGNIVEYVPPQSTGAAQESAYFQNPQQSMLAEQAAPVRSAESFEAVRSALSAIAGKPLTNRETGMTATISRKTINKMLSGKAHNKSSSLRAHLLAAANIDRLFENAVMGWTEAYNGNSVDVVGVHKMFAPLNVDGEMQLAKLTVKELRGEQGNRIYSVEAIDVGNKKSSVPEMTEAGINTDSTSHRLHGATVDSLVQQIQDYNIASQLAATAEAYGGEAAYNAAKAAGETELDYRQWVQVRTPAFKEWFGDWENDPDNASKVINPRTGEPLVVYHGTNAEFDTFMAQPGSDAGFHFGSIDAAQERISKKPGDSTMMPVFLNMRSPLSMTDPGRWDNHFDLRRPLLDAGIPPAQVKALFDEMNALENDLIDRISDDEAVLEAIQQETGRALAEVLRQSGYDGIAYTNQHEAKGSESFAVFDSNQIKSATGNSGAFSRESDNIYYQDAQSPPVSSLSGTEIAVDLSSDNAVAKVRDWFKDHLQGKIVHRDGVGDIRITGKSWKKIKRGLTTDLTKAQLIPAIPDILQKGEYKGRFPLEKARDDGFVAFHFFEANVEVGGQIVPAGVTVGEDAYGNLVYNINQNPQALRNKKAAHVTQEGSPGLDGYQGTNALEQSIEESGLNINILNQGNQSPRGMFHPDSNTIVLTDNADLSTFIHETGHFMLETMVTISNELAHKASLQGELAAGDKQFLADTQNLLLSVGVDLETWNRLSPDEKRPYHEQIARTFEHYIMTGQAPSLELSGAFARMRTWLVRIYKKFVNLNAPLSDEVKQIFDRMLATDEQIQLAEENRSMMPLFESAEAAGMTIEEFAEYQRLHQEARDTANTELLQRFIRDSKYIRNLKNRYLKNKQLEARKTYKDVQKQVRDEVFNTPVYRVWRILTRREKNSAQDAPALRLSIEALKEMGFKSKQIKKLGMKAQDENGIHPDALAEMILDENGNPVYDSGDALVKDLLAARKPTEVIADMTDKIMLERYAELSSPQAIMEAADMAAHNEIRLRMIATEFNTLAQALGKRTTAVRAAKEVAKKIISRQRISDIKPSQYTRMETRAAKASEQARKRGDIAAAAAEKHNQLLQATLARTAWEAKEHAAKMVRYLRRMADIDPKALPIEYREQIERALERFNLRDQTKKAIARTQSLAQWIESEREPPKHARRSQNLVLLHAQPFMHPLP